MRPALKYYGGKFNLAPFIINYINKLPHKHYIEPYCGAASILLRKPPSEFETINDLDGNVVNFFRVLRDSPDELIRKIQLTPWARDEYEFCRTKLKDDDSIEWARRFYVVCWQSFRGGPDVSLGNSWSVSRTDTNDRSTANHREDLYIISNRLSRVQIENKPAIKLIKLCDSGDALFYVDPPYFDGERNHKKVYNFDFAGKQPHVELFEVLKECKGFVILSGYNCPLYEDLYESHGWLRFDKEAKTNGNPRVESIWLSPQTWDTVRKKKDRQMEMF
jgi:DNA adenine methylase